MSHRRNGNGNGDGTPDWFFWSITFILLAIAVLITIFGDGIWS